MILSGTRFFENLLLLVLLAALAGCEHNPARDREPATAIFDLNLLEKKLSSYRLDPRYPDDSFVLVTVREGLLGGQERNGGIGACLVRKATGEIVERGHNSQYEPYFRSDLHAEMDLLNRYEERERKTRSRDPKDPTFRNPRNMEGLVLYTSVEPCPMCLGRIINAGVKEVYYAAPDIEGGMARRFQDLPPSWKNMARGMVIEPARCSPELREIARDLFRPMFMQGKTHN
ncbi:MAG: nucleoside deaminase [Geobacteraceae bacterium]